jgi:hypothetical protein
MVGWITALKVIPWGDVIEAAPALAKGARKFFTKTQQVPVEPVPPVNVPEDDALGQAYGRIHQLEQRVGELTEQQKASAALIESLAEQNAQVVRAIDVLRVRTRMLLVTGGAGVLALGGVIAWLATR